MSYEDLYNYVAAVDALIYQLEAYQEEDGDLPVEIAVALADFYTARHNIIDEIDALNKTMGELN